MYAKSSHDLPAFKRFYQLLVASSYVIIFKPQHRVLSLKHSCRLTPILAMGKRSHLNGGYPLFLLYHISYYILYRPLLFITPRANILQECLKLSWHQQSTISTLFLREQNYFLYFASHNLQIQGAAQAHTCLTLLKLSSFGIRTSLGKRHKRFPKATRLLSFANSSPDSKALHGNFPF